MTDKDLRELLLSRYEENDRIEGADYRDDVKWTVYVHIVPKSVSGYDYDKYYVGITSKAPCQRWKRGEGYIGQVFHKSVEKYGWDNIEHEIVATNLTEEEALNFEKVLITKLQARKYGYNCTDGGDGSFEHITYHGADHPNAVKIVLLNTREVFDCRIDASRKTGICEDSIYSSCNNKKICKSTDELGRAYVFMYYDEYRNMSDKEIEDKIYDCTIRRYQHCQRKDVSYVCLNTLEIFDNIFEAAIKYNVKASNIKACCAHRHKWCGRLTGQKLIWVYYSEYIKLSERDINDRIHDINLPRHCIVKKKRQMPSEKIVDLEKRVLYASCKQCCEHHDFSQSTLYRILHHTANNKYSDRFMFLHEYLELNNISEEEAKQRFFFIDEKGGVLV